jgi:hypothetical protein
MVAITRGRLNAWVGGDGEDGIPERAVFYSVLRIAQVKELMGQKQPT